MVSVNRRVGVWETGCFVAYRKSAGNALSAAADGYNASSDGATTMRCPRCDRPYTANTIGHCHKCDPQSPVTAGRVLGGICLAVGCELLEWAALIAIAALMIYLFGPW